MLPLRVNNHIESIKMTSGGFCHLIWYTLSFQLALIMKRTEAVSIGACDQYYNVYTWQDWAYQRKIKALRCKCWEKESGRRNVLTKVKVLASGVFVRLICFSFRCTQYIWSNRKEKTIGSISYLCDIYPDGYFLHFFCNKACSLWCDWYYFQISFYVFWI